jgi:hypothetical protein
MVSERKMVFKFQSEILMSYHATWSINVFAKPFVYQDYQGEAKTTVKYTQVLSTGCYKSRWNCARKCNTLTIATYFNELTLVGQNQNWGGRHFLDVHTFFSA